MRYILELSYIYRGVQVSTNNGVSQSIMFVSGTSSLTTQLWFGMFQTADFIALCSLCVFAISVGWSIFNNCRQNSIRDRQYSLDRDKLLLEMEKIKVMINSTGFNKDEVN